MSPIEAVLFDYGMVLSGPPNPAAWAHMRTITGLDEPSLSSGYWTYRHPYDRGDLTGEAYWLKLASDYSVTLTPEQIIALLAADIDLWGDPNPPMVQWAQTLQQSGFRTGILSNIGDAMASGLLARYSWLNNFYHCTWSYSLNLAKPEPAIYQHTIASLHTPAANILFIDDKPENIAAALACGLQAIQYSSHSAFEHEMHHRGLTDLLNIAATPSKTL